MADNENTYLVTFQGFTVKCLSLDDSVAFRVAGTVLGDPSSNDQSPAQLERIAEVLESYGHTAAAENLAHIASRMRAIQYLVGSVDYVPPKHPN